MSESIVIRAAQSGDCESIHKVLAETWMTSYTPLLGQGRARKLLLSPKVIQLMLDNPTSIPEHRMDVAVVDGDIVAFSWSGPGIWFGRSYLWMLYVLPCCQGRGIGRLLIRAACESFKGARSLRLHVLIGNLPGQKFYEKQGFHKVCNSWNLPTRQRVTVMEKPVQVAASAPATGLWAYLFG